MIKLNCDLGEYPEEAARDRALLDKVDAVSIACGGHAGSASSAKYWAQQAINKGKTYHLHLSYPDRANFGRQPLDIERITLADSLSAQREALPECNHLKLHGALYNQSVIDPDLAHFLVQWCLQNDIKTILAPPGSEMSLLASSAGLAIEEEGFADRSYQHIGGRLRLTPRSEPGAIHETPALAIAQIRSVLERGLLATQAQEIQFRCDTWCIHSDSPGALALAEAIRKEWPC